jgi:hypothetical protein
VVGWAEEGKGKGKMQKAKLEGKSQNVKGKNTRQKSKGIRQKCRLKFKTWIDDVG